MKEILAQIKQYKKDSILTPIFTALEVFMEMLLPFITAKIIDDETRDATGKFRILAFEHLVYVYLLHRVFPLVRPASVSTFP